MTVSEIMRKLGADTWSAVYARYGDMVEYQLREEIRDMMFSPEDARRIGNALLYIFREYGRALPPANRLF